MSGVWNTTAGQNSWPATPGTGIGNYWNIQPPQTVFDGNWTSAFASFGVGNSTTVIATSGLNTGVYLTIPGDPFVLKGFRFITAGFSTLRDPLKLTIEGSNLTGSVLTLGSSWSLIYNGTTGLDVDPGRNLAGVRQTLNNNTSTFSSYRFLIFERRGTSACVEYSEIQLYVF